MGVTAEHQGRNEGDALLAEIADGLCAVREKVDALLDEPSGEAAEQLLATLRSWTARAAALGLSAVAEPLRKSQLVVRAAAVLGEVDPRDAAQLAAALDEVAAALPPAPREQTPTSGPMPAVAYRPRSSIFGVLRAMVIGPARVAEALVAEDWATEDEGAPGFEVDHLADAAQARAAIAAKKPEVVIVDTSLDGARRLVERILGDRSLDAIPVIALGDWTEPGQAAPYIALGVARCLTRPVPPGLLRRACLEVAPAWQGSSFEPIGETSLEALSMRLAAEVRRGLHGAAEPQARDERVDLGDGGEVLTAIWGALARVRELVTARSQGRIRFEPGGPIPTLPRAAWLTDARRRGKAQRTAPLGEVRRIGEDASLEGFRVVIADDDLSTNWFLSGVLKEAGATVLEAFDGEQALDHAYRTLPDLMLADIVMPNLDGLSLCRAFKRDVVLRSVPVLLMSWKEDLLQRMRELGAEADGYLKKEASAEEIVRRIKEMLRPQRSVARRIAAGGAVRGRLDGIAPYTLLSMACRIRPDARVTVRDAHSAYEIEVRESRPVSATRTGIDGSTERGAHVLARLLGIGAGRFAIEPVEDEAAGVELEGSLDDQLRQPIALARAAQGLLGGATLLRIERVHLDEDALAMPLASTPEPARGLLRALVAGASPRTLIQSGRAPAELVERVLSDAARYGAVEAVIAQTGAELLAEAFERELAIVEGLSTRTALRKKAEAARLPRPVAEPVDEDASIEGLDEDDWSEGGEVAMHGDAPETPDMAPLAAPSARTSWAPDTPAFGGARAAGVTPVLASVEVSAQDRQNTPILGIAVTEPRLAELDPPKPAPAKAGEEVEEDEEDEPAPRRAKKKKAQLEPEAAFVTMPRLPMPSSYAPHPHPAPPPEKSSARWAVPLVFGAAGIALAVGARWWREQPPPAPMPPPMQAPAMAPTMQAPTPEADAPAPSEPEADEESDAEALTERPLELPLSDKEKKGLDEGQGLLEIVAGRNDVVFVDGKKVGKGPVVKTAVNAGEQPHEVRVKMRGEERVRYVKAIEGKRLRLRVAPPWSR